jgi:2-polyprenyl-6-methoxyphenol hydroxylase-like FAD-dependent oxidoreductase
MIVGAGPVGMCAALDLARRGISCSVIERSACAAVGTRARGISPRTQEIFESLGVLREIRRFSEPSLTARFYNREGVLVRESDAAPLSAATPDVPYPNALMVNQQNTNLVLRQRIAAAGIRLETGLLFTGLAQDEDCVTATVAGPNGVQTLQARYLIGADGGGSRVRASAGLQLGGSEWEDSASYLIGNVSVDGADRRYWHTWTDAEWGYVTLQPIFYGDTSLDDTWLDDTWLFAATVAKENAADWAVPDASAIERLFRQRIPSAKVSFGNLTWHSLYRRRLRIADRYRAGRVFLAGDAAHTGVEHGMNIGIQDGWNLAWKLAEALRGAPASLLDTYEEERRPIAAQILERTLEREATDSGVRGAAKSIASAVTRQASANDPNHLSAGYRGCRLSLDLETEMSVRAGDRAPDAPVLNLARNQRGRLFDVFHSGRFTFLHFTEGAPIEINQSGEAVDVWQIARTANRGRDRLRILVDVEGHAYTAYGAVEGSLVLIRPDGYIAARAQASQAPRVLLEHLALLTAA